ncbi:MAG TPA: hypothetical protein VHX38_34150 [Pseudonocardiaceae bacterium]|jgi:hypothetical protein|nr:hypothetical protein [Pseudonocardiaceae bacterium]
MSRGPDGPEDVDAAFAEIVAGLEEEGLGSFLTEEEPLADAGSPPAEPATGSTPAASPAPQSAAPATDSPGWRTSDTEWDWAASSDEEHYVPPEPPPFPRPRAGTVVGLLLIVVGLLLLIVPTMIGLAARLGTPLGLVSLAAGIGWLVLRIRHNSPPDHGDRDDGAQL